MSEMFQTFHLCVLQKKKKKLNIQKTKIMVSGPNTSRQIDK